MSRGPGCSGQGASDQVMNSYLAAKIFSFFVATLRNSSLLHTPCASNLNVLAHHLLRPDLIRGSLGKFGDDGGIGNFVHVALSLFNLGGQDVFTVYLEYIFAATEQNQMIVCADQCHVTSMQPALGVDGFPRGFGLALVIHQRCIDGFSIPMVFRLGVEQVYPVVFKAVAYCHPSATTKPGACSVSKVSMRICLPLQSTRAIAISLKT